MCMSCTCLCEQHAVRARADCRMMGICTWGVMVLLVVQVYASPSRRKMDTKGEGEEMTYPHICFMVDNFDEVFCDIVVRDGEMVCVELVARGRGGAAQAVIFLGSIRYDALTRVYDARRVDILIGRDVSGSRSGTLPASRGGGGGDRWALEGAISTSIRRDFTTPRNNGAILCARLSYHVPIIDSVSYIVRT
ncbi:unnamed protein product, partial [Brenthis ino]